MNILDDSILSAVLEPSAQSQQPIQNDSTASIQTVLDWMHPDTLLSPPSDHTLAAIQALEKEGPETLRAVETQYLDLVRTHFTHHAAPLLLQALASRSLPDLAAVIAESRRHYLYPVAFFSGAGEGCCERLADHFRALVVLTAPYTAVRPCLQKYLDSPGVALSAPADSVVHVLAAVADTYAPAGRVQDAVLAGFLADVTRVLVERYRGVWTREVRPEIDEWAARTLAPVAAARLFPQQTPSAEDLTRIVDDVFLDVRIDELFDIIVDFPESRPALVDIKGCVRNSHQRAAIVNSLQQSCSRRLLHGGANTVDVLLGYISIIRSLSLLEPRGVLLDKVARPIRRYLKDREDTIKEVLSGILGDKKSPIKELSQELVSLAVCKDAGPEEDDLKWQPDPLDAPPDFSGGGSGAEHRGGVDIIGSLISIFDNKDVMVKELMRRFADTMLFSHEFDEETVLMTIELLKLKFGEDALGNLDVMIKDMAESRRIDGLVHGRRDGEDKGSGVAAYFHADVISRLYWPRYNAVACVAPKEIEEQMKRFDGCFEKLKQGRELVWMGSLGSVTLEIEVEGALREYVVSPEKASLICLFQETEQWTVEGLVKRLETSEGCVKSALLFWQKRGLVAQIGADEYTLGDKRRTVIDDIGEAAAPQDPKEELRLYTSYIVGMLTNLGAVPAERIHSFLKVLVPAETPYTHTLAELQAFLDLLVEEEKLVVVGENYKLLNAGAG